MATDADLDRTPMPDGSGKPGKSRGRFPTDVLGERLLRLAMGATRAVKMRSEVASGVAAWKADLWASPHILREWVETLRDNLVDGYEAAAEAVQEMDRSDATTVRVAEANLASLGYARDAAVQEYARLAS